MDPNVNMDVEMEWCSNIQKKILKDSPSNSYGLVRIILLSMEPFVYGYLKQSV